MPSENRDAKFWRHMARLHEAQAANLRRRATVEDEDCKSCLERAKQAELCPAVPEPRPRPAVPQLPPAPPNAKQGKSARRG